jgi:hypothetical protein
MVEPLHGMEIQVVIPFQVISVVVERIQTMGHGMGALSVLVTVPGVKI